MFPSQRGTIRQKRLAEAIVLNAKAKKPKNKQEIVASSGYSATTARHHATTIIDQKGVQKELEVLGFTSENAKKVVANIMLNEHAEDRDRLTASKLVFEIHGDFAPEKRLNINVDAEALAKQINDDIARFRAIKHD